MESYGINGPFLFAQIISFLILCGWPLLALLALWRLRSRDLSGTALAIWALIVLVVPVLGAVALFIVDPHGDR